MSYWREIETAPKDGTWIMAFDYNFGMQIVHFINGEDGGDWYAEDRAAPFDDLTHWMPLPAMPDLPARPVPTLHLRNKEGG